MNTLFWLHFFGLDNGSNLPYLFWSGVGSDIGEVTILGAVISMYWKHTCNAKGCYRIGRHPVKGTAHVVCRKHHPDGEPTHAEIIGEHIEATN